MFCLYCNRIGVQRRKSSLRSADIRRGLPNAWLMRYWMWTVLMNYVCERAPSITGELIYGQRRPIQLGKRINYKLNTCFCAAIYCNNLNNFCFVWKLYHHIVVFNFTECVISSWQLRLTTQNRSHNNIMCFFSVLKWGGWKGKFGGGIYGKII